MVRFIITLLFFLLSSQVIAQNTLLYEDDISMSDSTRKNIYNINFEDSIAYTFYAKGRRSLKNLLREKKNHYPYIAVEFCKRGRVVIRELGPRRNKEHGIIKVVLKKKYPDEGISQNFITAKVYFLKNKSYYRSLICKNKKLLLYVSSSSGYILLKEFDLSKSKLFL